MPVIINGTANDDEITPWSSNVLPMPGDADEIINGGDGNDRIVAGGGNDIVHGGTGVDWLDSGSGDDILYGDDDGDVLIAGPGYDQLYGGGGNDQFYINDGLGNALIDGGADFNEVYLNFRAIPHGVTFTVPAADTSLITPGGSRLTLANIDLYWVDGTDYADTFYGSSKTDVFRGEGGDDTIHAGLGDDTLFYSAGDDTLHGDEGVDELWGLFGEATAGVVFNLGSGTGTFTSSLGTTSFYDIERTRFYGSLFDDVVTGGAGQDELYGDEGNDRLVGGGSINTLDGGNGQDWLQGGDDSNRLLGGNGDDTIWGGGNDDELDGGPGDDTLVGNGRDDTVSYANATGGVEVDLSWLEDQNTRGAGIDTLVSIEGIVGSAFDDRLAGNEDFNTFIGGAGADKFVFAQRPGISTSGLDLIVDFSSAQGDKIVLSAEAFGLPLGDLAGSAFVVGSQAMDADDRVIYDPYNSRLLYDADGNGSGEAQFFLTIFASITAADVFII